MLCHIPPPKLEAPNYVRYCPLYTGTGVVVPSLASIALWLPPTCSVPLLSPSRHLVVLPYTWFPRQTSPSVFWPTLPPRFPCTSPATPLAGPSHDVPPPRAAASLAGWSSCAAWWPGHLPPWPPRCPALRGAPCEASGPRPGCCCWARADLTPSSRICCRTEVWVAKHMCCAGLPVSCCGWGCCGGHDCSHWLVRLCNAWLASWLACWLEVLAVLGCCGCGCGTGRCCCCGLELDWFRLRCPRAGGSGFR